MDREALLGRLSVRLTYLAGSSDAELNDLLEKLRSSIKDESDTSGLSRLSDRLTKLLLVHQEKPAVEANNLSMGEYAQEFSQSIKALPLAKPYVSKLAALAEQLASSSQVDQQLQVLRDIFKLIHVSIEKTPSPKGSSGVLGWFDKKGKKADEQWQDFLGKSSQLLDKILSHIDVLNGDSAETQGLKEQLLAPSSVDAVEEVLEEVISLLEDMTGKVNHERVTTQNFLGDLREQLHHVEETIFSVINDGEDSLGRAESLEKQVNDDVQVIGQAVQEDDLAAIKLVVEAGLVNLSSKVADYLTVERQEHEESKKKVKSLTRKVREMEAETVSLHGEIKTKQDLAVKDALTGVYNRAGYEERIAEEFARRQRVSTPLSLVFVDCDNFKQINDSFGHNAGDVVLVKIAETLKKRSRTSDIVARYGGDEFVVLLPDTPIDGAEVFAKDACKKVLNAGFNNNGEPLNVSISCGITEVREGDTPITALQRADEAMYEAKKQTVSKVFAIS